MKHFLLMITAVALLGCVSTPDKIPLNAVPASSEAGEWEPKKTHAIIVGVLEWKNGLAPFPKRNRKDQDGDKDIVIGNVGQQNVIYFNEAKGTKYRSLSFGVATSATYCVALGDLNGDKYPDIVIGNSGTHNYVYLNVGKAAKADVIVKRQDYPLN